MGNLIHVSVLSRAQRLSRAVILVTLAICGLSVAGRADNPSRELPRNGSWVRYHWTWERIGSAQKTSGTVTLSLVGSAMEGSDLCRWIEVKFEIPEGDEQGTLVQKLLIREKDLREGSNPIEHVVRTWVRFNDSTPRLKERNNDSAMGPLLLWSPGVLAKPGKQGPPKDIEYQGGRLKAATQTTGKLQLSEAGGDPQVVFLRSRTFSIRMHEQLPIGFAEAEIEDEVYEADKQTLRSRQVETYLLQEFGTGATSSLPDRS